MMLIVAFIFFNPFRFREKQAQRIATAEQGMTASHFILHHPKSNAYLLTFGTLFWGIVYALLVFFSPDTLDIMLILFAPLALLFGIMQGIYIAVWKLEVAGPEMRLRTLFRRREFSFSDIQSVEIRTLKYYGFIDTGNVHRLLVHFRTGQRISVDVHIVGYRFFVERLRERNIPGIEKLAEIEAKHKGAKSAEEALQETKKLFLKFGLSKKGLLLYLAQIAIFISVALPLLSLIFFERHFFAGAYGAEALLERYRLVLQVGLGSILLWFVLNFIGNWIVLRRARGHGLGLGGYIVLGSILLLALGMILGAALVFDEDGLWPGLQIVQEDLAAIEQDELLVIRVETSVYTTHGRPWRLLGTETLAVYRSDFSGEPYFLHFSRAENLNILTERFLGPEYQFFGRNADIRVFEVSYTPNLHLVVEVSPIATVTLEQAEELVGTWDWDEDDSFTYLFHPDGTGSRGFVGDVSPFIWQTKGTNHLQIVINERLEDWTFRVEGGILTIENWLVPEWIFSYIAR